MIMKLCMLGIWMVFVPVGAGYFALYVGRKNGDGMDVSAPGTIFGLGYILMWAVFQLIAVPFVLKAGRFRQVELVFEAVCLTFAIAGSLLFLLHARLGLWNGVVTSGREAFRGLKSREGLLRLSLWSVFLAGLLFQMLQAYRLAYADGDDAYYIPISTAANLGGGMYAIDSYTGAPTTLDLRHGLAPFPIWVSFIAAKCGVNAAVAAHSLMPLVLIPVTYVLYLEIGRKLCGSVLSEGRSPGKGSALEGAGEAPDGKRKSRVDVKALLPLFMIFVSLLQIFGNYSIYPASTFLLTRTRQGKAALGNVILPFLFLLLYKVAEEVKKQGRAGNRNVLWLMAAVTAGCLCSTMAGFLCGMLLMMTAMLLFLLYRKPYILWQGLLGCLPGIVFSLLYLRAG